VSVFPSDLSFLPAKFALEMCAGHSRLRNGVLFPARAQVANRSSLCPAVTPQALFIHPKPLGVCIASVLPACVPNLLNGFFMAQNEDV